MKIAHTLAVHSPGASEPLGTIELLGDGDLVPYRWRGRVYRATGILRFWRGWHASTVLKFYRRLGWRVTRAEPTPKP